MSTVFVQRNGGVIVGAYAQLQPGIAEEEIDVTTAEYVTFLSNARPSMISCDVFIGRWTRAEYALLWQRRATAITNGGAAMDLVKQWDQAMVRGSINTVAQVTLDFKAAIVSAGILTQQRADAIFSGG